MSCCTYSCTQYGLHTQYMLQTNADVLLCLQLHTVRAAYTVHASNQCRCLAVPTAAHSTVSPFLTIVMFSFEPSHVSLILLKYKCRFLFSCRQCNITSYPHILKPNKLLCLQWNFLDRTDVNLATKFSIAPFVCLIKCYRDKWCSCAQSPYHDIAIRKAERSWRILREHVIKTLIFEVFPFRSTHKANTGQTTDRPSLWLWTSSGTKTCQSFWRYINPHVPVRRTDPSLFIAANNLFKLEVNPTKFYSIGTGISQYHNNLYSKDV